MKQMRKKKRKGTGGGGVPLHIKIYENIHYLALPKGKDLKMIFFEQFCWGGGGGGEFFMSFLKLPLRSIVNI